MRSAFILSARRTPIGRFHGALSKKTAVELGATAISSAVQRAGVESSQVEEVIMGNVLSAGAGQAPARQAALGAGLSPDSAALTINKVCGSGLKSVMLAAQAIRAGDTGLLVAGGLESMSRAPYLLSRSSPKMGHRELIDSMLFDGLQCAGSSDSMGLVAERMAQQEEVSRADQDNFAGESHRRAVAAMAAGAFDAELTPVGDVQLDEGPRSDATLDRLASLPAAFEAQGSITAGNSSMISDGVAATVVASQRAADRCGAAPLARIVAYATTGTAPENVFLVPVSAVELVLQRANLRREEIDLFEINEAFAAAVLATMQRLDLPADRVNVHGGAIALGHPIGASGARILATLIHALRRQDRRYGLATMCLGGGNAVAMIVDTNVT